MKKRVLYISLGLISFLSASYDSST